MPDSPPPLLTFGHGTLDQDGIVAALRAGGVRSVVDVRRFPGSRRHPHVGRDALAGWLPDAGVAYRWEERLGGRRSVRGAEAVDTWWQVAAFRAYAAHTRTDAFRAGMGDLLAEVAAAGDGRVAVMCSETVWWRCHRRLVGDVAVLLHDVEVLHLAHDGRLAPHRPAAGARVTDEGLVYDAPADAG
ncbi:DUF488 family protein [Cellulomonas sp. JZ18]|uniref:DUF488 domain-containing protein n=1 Tax=Cellulomonas sp. JZ18 TaxID=2654191 RepID=UPI0012D3AFC1|nr:DUF488 domain-containing protein [Cellulomonas sp. JZ18]QGQ18808.1 DUF488 family protein [Cellulomonas sp. JZ18]